ncbi:leucine-rich repeat-containing G-protein coupled receptor 4-like [Poecilia latipinna]|uniref:leucine-rich repeat-containing G-protein coupled receptor 4-like n=1 Tax=Poecilia latipinna TaxID=48699 RepID=UPI00072DB2ED|nr:PREDICTED: leucine-rich repeat-containing G-protein coupled receptor 4-like [Poecilia latipinna]
MQLFLLLLFLLLHGAMAASVPGCLSDRDKDHRPRENCSGAGFSHVPAGLDQQTQVLLFPSNLFSSLSWTSFQVFPDLYELDLTANQVCAAGQCS